MAHMGNEPATSASLAVPLSKILLIVFYSTTRLNRNLARIRVPNLVQNLNFSSTYVILYVK